MNNIEPKGHIVCGDLKQFYDPNIKIVYTINVYTSSKLWCDNLIDIILKLKLNNTNQIREFKKILRESFNARLIFGKLFFDSKQECENVINSLDNILIMIKLIS